MTKNPQYNPTIHHRRSLRLQGYDYSQAGAYFITICIQNRECLFGEIADGEKMLNDAGRMIQTIWNEIPIHYQGIETDEFVVMPNHIHGIVAIVGAGPRACPDDRSTPTGSIGHPQKPGHPQGGVQNPGHPQGGAPTLSLPDVVHRFKTMTTKRHTDGVKKSGWQPFPGKLWQRNYDEHVIRNEVDLNRVREYIANNPVMWQLDENYLEVTCRNKGDHS